MPLVRRLSVDERRPKRAGLDLSTGVQPGGAFLSPDRGRLTSWQMEVERLCEVDGLARFGVGVVADAASMFELPTERYTGTEWKIEHDPFVDLVMDTIFRDGEGSLFWRLIYHWRSVGEGWFVDLAEDGELPRIEVVATSAVERHGRGGFTVRFRQAGTVARGEAVWRPSEKMMRFWNPDPNFLQEAQSPMRSILEDLRRYRMLGHVISATSQSALLARGIFWVPQEALGRKQAAAGDDGKVSPKEAPELVKSYYEASRRSLEGGNDRVDVGAVAPLMMWYSNDLQKPVHITFPVAFDGQLAPLRSEAAEAVGRGLDLPAVMVVNGGQGGGVSSTHSNRSNHWTDLLIDRRFIEGTVNKSVKPICHEWLTKLLRIYLSKIRAKGTFRDDPANWRISFDSSQLALSASPDPHTAVEGYKLGLLKPDAVRTAIGFKAEDAPTPGESAAVLRFLATSGQRDRMLEPSVDTSRKVAADLPREYLGRVSTEDDEQVNRRRQAATALRRIVTVDQRTVAEVIGQIDAAYAQAVPTGSRTSPSKKDVALAVLLRRSLEVGNDARLRAAEEVTGLSPDLLAATSNAHVNVEDAVRMVVGARLDPKSPGFRQSVIQLARDAVAIAAGARIARGGQDGLAAGEDARRRLDGVTKVVVAATGVELDWRWEHAFYGEPVKAFPSHVELDGSVHGPEGPAGWWPGDHFGCTCELVPEVRF